MHALLRLPIRFGLLFGLIAGLSACASWQNIDATPEQMSRIESITVLRQPQEMHYTVENQGGISGVLGGLGTIIESAHQTSKESVLLEKLQPLGVRINATLADELAARLRDRGYAVRVEDAPPVVFDISKRSGYDSLPETSDAVLIVLPASIGFVSPVGDPVYYPTITARVDLVPRDRTTSLYRGSHATGWEPYGGWRYTPQTIQFPNFDDLTKNPRATVDALVVASKSIADSIASQIPARSDAAKPPAPAASPAPAAAPRRGRPAGSR